MWLKPLFARTLTYVNSGFKKWHEDLPPSTLEFSRPFSRPLSRPRLRRYICEAQIRAIADGKTDTSALSRIADETTDVKSARGNDPKNGMVTMILKEKITFPPRNSYVIYGLLLQATSFAKPQAARRRHNTRIIYMLYI
jgi:hypothetical protein